MKDDLKNMGKNADFDKRVCIILMIIYAVSMIPVFWIGQYSVPSADDFSYSFRVHNALISGEFLGSIICRAIYEILRQVAVSYLSWQGTYAAIMLFTIQPAIWNERAYVIVPYIMTISMTIGVLMFSWWLFYRRLKCFNQWQAISLGILWMILNIQLMPSPAEGLYWYNGSVYYTFFYGLMLLLYALVLMHIDMIHNNKPLLDTRRKKSVFVFMCILAFGVGGGNFVTGLITAILDVCLLIYCVTQKKRETWVLKIPALLFALGFTLSVIAPGNSVRKARFTQMGELEAIYYSLYYAFFSIKGNWNPLVFTVVLIILPMLWKTVKSSVFSFRCPVVVTSFTFCLYAAMYCPVFYATSYNQPGRILNIIRYTYHFIVLFNIWYWLGWFRCFLKRFELKNILILKKLSSKRLLCVIYVGAVLILLIQVWMPNREFSKTITSARAVHSLLNGEAEKFYQEHQERFALLRNSKGEVGVKPLSVKPRLLYNDDISTDETYWINGAYEQYFGVERVYVLTDSVSPDEAGL